MQLLIRVAAFALVILLVDSNSLLAQSIARVGVLAPDRGLQTWLGDQIKAGTIYASDESLLTECKASSQPHLEVIFGGGALADEASMKQAVEALIAQGVDVIIGGNTEIDAAILRNVVHDREIPTVLLTESKGFRDNGGDAIDVVPHILQIGLSQEDVYRAAFEKWLEVVEDINSFSAVYAENDAVMQKYAVAITPELLQEHSVDSQFYQIPYKSTGEPQYDGVIKEISDVNPDALIFSGSSFDIKNLIYKAAVDSELGPKPIYVAPPFGTEEQNVTIDDYAYAPIYFGAQFWPDSADECTQGFIEGVRSHLNWPTNVPFSTLAIKAYDAMQVVSKAWEDGIYSGWEEVEIVEGITGQLVLQDDHVTMAGPTRLVVSDPAEGLAALDVATP